MDKLAYYRNLLQGVNIFSITVRLALAILIGGIIGIDRGKKRRPAGIKTHVLVCMGAAIVMLTSQFVSVTMGGTEDITRMGAQVISGIGFLGVGTIIITGSNQIRGLTTAAGLWCSACLGLAIGIGFYSGAVIACLFMLFVFKLLAKIDVYIYKNSTLMDLNIEIADTDYLGNIVNRIRKCDCKVLNLEIGNSKIDGMSGGSISTTLYLNKGQAHEDVIAEISNEEGIRFIEEI